MLEREPHVLNDSGLELLRRYLELCQEVQIEPDDALVRRVYAVLVSAGVVTPEK